MDDNDEKRIRAHVLNIFCYRLNKFEMFSVKNFPKSQCVTCVPRFEYRGKTTIIPCGYHPSSWNNFKRHVIKVSEKRMFKKIAFLINDPAGLPDLSIYHQFRFYGDLKKYKENIGIMFLVYDFKMRKFITYKNRYEFKEAYIKNKKCEYCGCGKKMIGISSIFDHIANLEQSNKCFLIIDSIEQNSEENELKLNKLISKLNIPHSIDNGDNFTNASSNNLTENIEDIEIDDNTMETEYDDPSEISSEHSEKSVELLQEEEIITDEIELNQFNNEFEVNNSLKELLGKIELDIEQSKDVMKTSKDQINMIINLLIEKMERSNDEIKKIKCLIFKNQ